MSEPRQFVRAMLRLGPRKLLRRAGFRQPGGGQLITRQHGDVLQTIRITLRWRGGPMGLSFPVWQSFQSLTLWSWERPQEFHVDPESGDPADLAVAVGEWLRTELLPALEAPLEPLRLAQAFEVGEPANPRHLYLAERVYRGLGRPDDVARVRQVLDTSFGGYPDAPF